jgi:DNA-binding NarL/FixJ family response regulator
MKIVILDDHPLILNFLQSEIYQILPKAQVISFTEVSPTIHYIKKSIVDFVICDLQIINGKNLEVPTTCFESKIPYMVFSSHTNKIIYDQLKKLSVLVYVSKAAQALEIKNGLIALLNHKKYFCSNTESLAEKDPNIIPTDAIITTPRQKLILELLNLGLTQLEVSEKLSLSERTIYNHLSMLRDKNDCHTTAELLRRYKFWN